MNTPLGGTVRTRRARTSLVSAAALLTLGLTIAGCTPTSTNSRPTSSSSSSASPTPTATPTPPSSTSSPAEPQTSSNPGAPTSIAGCAPNDAVVPAGAETSPIEDVDFDGRADTQFFAEEPDFFYGISTASGAVYMLRTDLAGPGKHSGWSAQLESGLVVTVLDDSRTATLHTFTNCAFQTTTAPDGSDASIDLKGMADAHGVQCSSGNGGRWLNETVATRLESGRFTITSSTIEFSSDGTTATRGIPSEVVTDVPADDPRVALASQSTCGDIPKVATSGM